MSRSEINARRSTGERCCWSDRVVDEAHLISAGIGLGDQKTAKIFLAVYLIRHTWQIK